LTTSSKLQEIRISKYAVPHNVSLYLKNKAPFQEAIIKIRSALLRMRETIVLQNVSVRK